MIGDLPAGADEILSLVGQLSPAQALGFALNVLEGSQRTMTSCAESVLRGEGFEAVSQTFVTGLMCCVAAEALEQASRDLRVPLDRDTEHLVSTIEDVLGR